MAASYFVILAVVFAAVNGSSLKYQPADPRPWFCHGIGCPKYDVEETNKDYELRKYDPSQWVSTRTVGMDFMVAEGVNFERLFVYISGANVKKEKISMTAPVLTKILPGAGPACENDFTMSFFVDQENAPRATDSSVFLTTNQTISVYVRSFKGFVRKVDTWLNEASQLADALQAKGRQYETSFYFTAGYDSPFRLLDRHNEIWFLAK